MQSVASTSDWPFVSHRPEYTEYPRTSHATDTLLRQIILALGGKCTYNLPSRIKPPKIVFCTPGYAYGWGNGRRLKRSVLLHFKYCSDPQQWRWKQASKKHHWHSDSTVTTVVVTGMACGASVSHAGELGPHLGVIWLSAVQMGIRAGVISRRLSVSRLRGQIRSLPARSYLVSMPTLKRYRIRTLLKASRRSTCLDYCNGL